MNHITTIKIHETPKNVLNDVQLWSDEETLKLPNVTSCFSLSWIRYTALPLHVITSLPITIYSNDSATSDYFKRICLKFPYQITKRIWHIM